MKFLDANIFLRFLTWDDRTKADACQALFKKVEQGEEDVTSCEAIIAEVVYVLTSTRLPYHFSHPEVRAGLLPILTLRNLHLPQKGVYLRALEIYATSPFLDFEDALATAHMEQQGIAEILSYDRDFDRISEVSRLEP